MSDDIMDLTPKQEAILIMQGLGFNLIPLIGKRPFSNEWQKTTASTIDYTHKTNYGVVLRETDLVIDIDVKNGGNEALQELLTNIGIEELEEFKSMIVQSGGGGLHIYLKKPKDLKTRYLMKQYKGIEFRTKGHQMVGPLCIHPETKSEYTFFDSCREIAPAPDALLTLIKDISPLAVDKKETKISKPTEDSASISRYIHYLQDESPAIEGDNGDTLTYTVACKGKDFGLELQTTHRLMSEWWNTKCQPPWSTEELQVKVANAYSYGKKPVGSDNPLGQFQPIAVAEEDSFNWDYKPKTKIPLGTLNNAVNFFHAREVGLRGLLRYNVMTRDVEFTRPAPWHNSNARKIWGDNDIINARYYLSSKHKFDVPANLIHEAAIVVADAHKYHPLQDRLNSLVWDNIPRINSWLSKYAGVKKGVYSQTIGRKTLIAAVARAFQPGIKFDQIMVLEGDQGVGKSTLCQVLGGDFYADVNLDPSSKDTVGLIHGKWIVELSEMHTAKKSESDALKAFISRGEDRIRPAYARVTEDYPRSCIFIGTINPDADTGYLKDQTGNRRFWPIFMEKLDRETFERDVDQLWAEAVHYYKQGEPLYITDEDINKIALAEAHKRKVTDAWLFSVSRYLNLLKTIEGETPTVIYLENIWTDAFEGSLSRFTQVEKNRLSSVLKDLGYVGRVLYDHELKETRYGYTKKEDGA